MNDQIVFEISQEVVTLIKLGRQMTLGFEAEQQWIGGRRRHVSETLTEGRIELIQNVMAAISDQMQINLMAMLNIGRVGRLISQIKMKLMTAEPGKGEDLLR